MRTVTPAQPTLFTQTIALTIRATGKQQVVIDTHGARHDVGSHISLCTAGVAVYLYDAAAARTYAAAWIDLTASLLLRTIPERVDIDADDRRAEADSPAVVIRAHGYDEVKHSAVPGLGTGRDAVAIRIGRVAWLMQDRAAYRSLLSAWQQVHDLTPIVLGGRLDQTRFGD